MAPQVQADHSELAIDSLEDFDLNDEQFSSFLAALDEDFHECAANDGPDLGSTPIGDLEPSNLPLQQSAEQSGPHVSSAGNGAARVHENARKASYSAVERISKESVGEQLQGHTSTRGSLQLASLPTAQEAQKERYRAKNRRNQKAYRERMKVCAVVCSVAIRAFSRRRQRPATYGRHRSKII